jgi:tetratricopeptide (TPR) repeat protein/tRNA A-37 threonylcarbamoyl transferase component Bud32
MDDPDPVRHRVVKDHFEALLDTTVADQPAALARVRQTDGALADELEALLAAHAAAGDFLEWEPPDDAGAEPPVDDPLIGRRLGSYRLISAIGRGGMGTVYLAERVDAQVDQRVAIKVLRAGLDPSATTRFRHERQILATLSHPYIAHLMDASETEERQPYFVMERVEGRAITEHCDSLQLDTRERVRLFLRVCEAVRFAHAHLIVHRDIKPSNILVTAEGVPKLLDFGIAKLVADLSGGPGVQTALFLTLDHASPEQVQGQTVAVSSDVYSLGVLLYELLVGAGPYRRLDDDSSVYAALEAICRDEPERPSTAVRRLGRARRVDADLDAILLKTIRKSPADRYGSVEQLADDLTRYLAGRPVYAREMSATYRLGRFVRRRWVGVGAAAAVLASLRGTVVVSRRQSTIAEAERAKAERRFEDVRQLASAFVFEFDGAIQALPGATAARKLVISRGLEYLERLAQDASDAPLLRELASAYQKIGDVQGNPFFPNLGDLAGAAKSYQRALELRERLAKLPDANDTDTAGFAVALAGTGDLLWAGGDFPGALREYGRASSLSAGLLARDPANAERGYQAARAAYFVGQALTKLGRFDEALTQYRVALRGYESVAEARPDRPDYRRGVAVALLKVGDCLGRAGDQTAALAQYERGLAGIEALVRAQPSVAIFARMRGFLLNRVAIGRAEMGDLAGALEASHSSLAQAETLARIDPVDRQIRRDVATFLSSLGGVELQLEHRAAAQAVLTRSIAIYAEMARAGTVSIDQRSEHGVTLRRAGDADLEADKRELARAHYEAAARLLEADPRDLEYEGELALVYMRLGEVVRGRSRGPLPESALQWLQKSRNTWRSAEARGIRPGRLAPGGASVVDAMLSGPAGRPPAR